MQVTQTSLDEELLKQWATQVKRSPPPVILSMTLLALMASQYISAWYWGTWLFLVCLVQAIRWYVFRQIPERTDVPLDKRIRIVGYINFAGTLLHTASLAWFPLFTPYQASVQSILFVGLGVGSVMTCAGYPQFARHHAFYSLIPLFILWIWSGLFGPGGGTALFLGVIGFGYTALILRIADNIFLLYNQSFETRSQLEVALEQAEAAGRAKTRFLASASHDLRQPIHAMSLFGAALATRDLDESTREIVDNINASVEALSYELDGLLDISKLDAGIVTVNPSQLCLYNLLERVQEEFSSPAQDKVISMRVEGSREAMVETDGVLLERIVRNLVANAINHNSQCTLLLRVLAAGDSWRLEVEDSGSGIDPSQHQHIFEEFYQLENHERDRSKGLGLGLSIVRRLSELLDIDMEFESVPGEGTKFGFTLDAMRGGMTEKPRQDFLRQSDELLHSLVVLVVDDEKSVRDGMQALLGSLGCRVVTADSTKSALMAATELEPDIVLVDFRLRDEDSGLAVISRLRERYPGLPAVIISGETAPDRLLEINQAAIPVLVKPVLIGPLKEAIVRNCFPEALPNGAPQTAGTGA